MARFEVTDFQDGKVKIRAARYVAWVVPGDGPVRVVDLGLAEAIDTDVHKVRKALQDAPKTIRLRGEADAEKELREVMDVLAKEVLHPLLPYVGKNKEWIISPDSNLWLVPWAALTLPDGKYAVEDHAISFVVSGRELVGRPQEGGTPGKPLVLADPDFDLGLDKVALETRRLLQGQEAPTETRGTSKMLRLGGVRRLPGTAAEAEALKAKLEKYAGSAPRVLKDQEALAGVFQMAKHPKVVVLSTHGYFLPDEEIDAKTSAAAELKRRGTRLENPLLRCGLLLAGCNNAAKATEGTDNGVLTGLQIVGTDLRGCELVVLSACETGLGEVRNGEGVAGLRQAFQLAGAESVVATLWQIPDQQSAQLMIHFFDNLADKQSKPSALREAQLAIIQARRDKGAAAHPFYWAAYTLTGR